MSEKLGCLEWWRLGGIYSPNHQTNRWGGCLSMGAPDSPVRQPRHPTVRVLTVSTVGALTFWGTGQSLFIVRCSFWRYSDSARNVRALFTFAGDRWSWPLRLRVVAKLAHRTLRWIIAGRLSRNPKVKSLSWSPLVHRTLSHGTPDSPVRQTRVLFGFFCSFLLNPNFDLFIGLCGTFSTCRIYNLEQTS
jgi:hypothetical protein